MYISFKFIRTPTKTWHGKVLKKAEKVIFFSNKEQTF